MSRLFDGMEYVYAVYREKSFTKAADKLFISQPSLSARVKAIENKLGFDIFDRSTKPFTLTEYGKKYIDSVEQIIMIENEFMNYRNDLLHLEIGELALGACNLYSSWILPAFTDQFSSLYPHIQLNLIEENTGNLFSMVKKDQIDIIVDNYPLPEEDFERLVYRKERVYLAVPAKYEENRSLSDYQVTPCMMSGEGRKAEAIPPVCLDAFRDRPFILMKPTNHTRSISDHILHLHQIQPHVVFEMDQQVTCYNITSQGLGISFICDTLVRHVPPDDRVIYYNLDPGCNSRSVSFYWKRGRYLTTAMRHFLQMVKASAASFPARVEPPSVP